MNEKEAIRRLYFIKRHSIRQIARERHHSRKTVRKALLNPSMPQYHLATPKPCPVMDVEVVALAKALKVSLGWLMGEDG